MAEVHPLQGQLVGLDPLARLKALRDTVDGRIVFTTSFGLEDQVLTDFIFTADIAIDVVTLDTGRLFPETYQLWNDTEMRYAKRIRGYYPDTAAVEALVADQGIDGQYMASAYRKACCTVRKVAPLGRALVGASAWVTGLRAGQSAGRSGFALVSVDPGFGLLKVNPLIDVAREALVGMVARRNIPVNPLHDRGFVSIGCAPCTRAISPGEDERAGRWWWENETAKECGLHATASSRSGRGAQA